MHGSVTCQRWVRRKSVWKQVPTCRVVTQHHISWNLAWRIHTCASAPRLSHPCSHPSAICWFVCLIFIVILSLILRLVEFVLISLSVYDIISLFLTLVSFGVCSLNLTSCLMPLLAEKKSITLTLCPFSVNWILASQNKHIRLIFSINFFGK